MITAQTRVVALTSQRPADRVLKVHRYRRQAVATETLDADPVLVLDRFKDEIQLACPLFQRRYVWDKDNIEQLWRDLDTVLDGEYPKRFLGALVFNNESQPKANRAGRYWIIDGQQRLTTLYLMLVAIAEAACELGEAGVELARDTFASYLVSTRSQSKGEPRFRPTLVDSKQFQTILHNAATSCGYAPVEVTPAVAPGDKTGTMTAGYETIQKAISKRLANAQGKDDTVTDDEQALQTLEGLRSAILEQLEFVEIRLGTEHDPNEVFDRLNKEGERLGIVDLVRNDVLKHLDADPQAAQGVFTNDWLPFEEGFESETSKARYFFPFALTLDDTVTQATTFKKLSEHLKKEAPTDSPQVQVQAMVRTLRRHLVAYNAINSGRLERFDEPVKEHVRRLVSLNRPTSVYPYVMQLLTASMEGAVSASDAAECLSIIESFLVRRALCGIEPTGLHAVFKKLWKSGGADPTAVRAGLTSKTVVYPDDPAFEVAIRSGNLYARKVRNYVIEEYERSFTTGDVLKHFPPITVDHVVPQARKGEWAEVFTEAEHSLLVHTWGNLVPLSNEANSTKGTLSWADARDKLGNETVFSTTKHLYDAYNEWTPRSVRARTETLVEWSLVRWPSYDHLI